MISGGSLEFVLINRTRCLPEYTVRSVIMPLEQPGDASPVLTNQTDAELYLGLKTGQSNALGVLYDRHAGLVYGIAFNLLSNAQEAEDLTQDIFLALARGCSYDPKRGTLRTFLAILTRSRALDRIRSRDAAHRMLERSQPNPSEEVAANLPLEWVSQNEQSQEMQAALAQLSEEQQQILRMSYYDGLSQAEIARRLGIPLGTVKARARRGLLKLRQTLSDSTQ